MAEALKFKYVHTTHLQSQGKQSIAHFHIEFRLPSMCSLMIAG